MYNNTFMVEGTFASKDSVFCALNMHIGSDYCNFLRCSAQCAAFPNFFACYFSLWRQWKPLKPLKTIKFSKFFKNVWKKGSKYIFFLRRPIFLKCLVDFTKMLGQSWEGKKQTLPPRRGMNYVWNHQVKSKNSNERHSNLQFPKLSLNCGFIHKWRETLVEFIKYLRWQARGRGG